MGAKPRGIQPLSPLRRCVKYMFPLAGMEPHWYRVPPWQGILAGVSTTSSAVSVVIVTFVAFREGFGRLAFAAVSFFALRCVFFCAVVCYLGVSYGDHSSK